MTATIKLRRGTSAQWSSSNTVLALGEPGLDTDLDILKFGDGVTHWVDLPVYGLTKAAADANYGKAQYPTYIATNGIKPANRFDTTRSIYNWKASNTKKLRASLNRLALGTTLEQHVFVGDSETHNYCGSAGVFDVRQMWPRRYRDTLMSMLGVASGGEGLIRTGKAGSTGQTEGRWALTNWTVFTNYAQATTNGAVATCLTSEACTAIDVYYVDSGTGAASITIDGANTKTFTAVNSGSIKKLSWTGLTSSTHTIALTTTTANATYLYAVGAYNATGLVCQNMGQYGTQITTDWNNATSNYYSHCLQRMFGGTGPISTVASGAANGAANPGILHVQLGVNDIKNTATAPAVVTAALQTVLGWFSGAEIYLYAQMQPTSVTQANWEAYVATLYGLADALDVPLFDWHHRTGGATQATADGKLSTDGLHPSVMWQYEQARTIAAITTA